MKTLNPQNIKLNALKSIILFSFLGLVFFQLIVIENRRFHSFGVSLWEITNNHSKKIGELPSFQAMKFLKERTPQDSLVFSLQPSEMFYSNRRMLSYLDYKLVDFYLQDDVNRAYNLLLNLGVKYVHVPNYSLPPLTDSYLQQILDSPKLSELVFYQKGFSIYRLSRNTSEAFQKFRNVSSVDIEWIKCLRYKIGGRQVNFSLLLDEKLVSIPVTIEQPLLSGSVVSLWNVNSNKNNETFQVEGGKEYRLCLDLKGTASVNIEIIEQDHEKNDIQKYQLDQLALKNDKIEKSYFKRIITQKNCRYIKIGIEIKPRGKFVVSGIKIEEICYNKSLELNRNYQ